MSVERSDGHIGGPAPQIKLQSLPIAAERQQVEGQEPEEGWVGRRVGEAGGGD